MIWDAAGTVVVGADEMQACHAWREMLAHSGARKRACATGRSDARSLARMHARKHTGASRSGWERFGSGRTHAKTLSGTT